MRVVKMSLAAVVLTVVLSASAFAQATQPPTGGARPQNPPAQPPATAAQPAAPKPATPPVPFPQDAKIAFIDIQAIASNSVAGKAATQKLADLDKKMRDDINEKSKNLQAMQSKLNTGGSVLNEAARGQLEKDIDKAQRELQFAQSNYQADMQSLQNELQTDFQKKLLPVIEEVAKEKGLHAVFNAGDSGAAYIHPGLNLTDEVVKRLDAKK